MYEDESSFFELNKSAINYHTVESPQYESDHSFFGNDISKNNCGNSKHQNETLVLAFHSSLLCFKIALCVLL